MTVYVDDMQARYRRMVMCHMLADTDEELHAMADAIGVARKWHQKAGTPHSHYDICLSKKAKALKLGAVLIGRKEVAELVQSKRVAFFQERVKKVVILQNPKPRIPFPEETAPIAIDDKCPICGSPLMLNAGECLERDVNGEWIATEVQLDCTSEPDIKSPDWDEWYRGHYSTPYIDWLPLHQKVLKEVRQKYYFTE